MSENNSGQVARRIFSILEAFSVEEPELSALELSRRLEIPRSTVHRLLSTLIQEGYIDQDPNTLKYRLGLKLLRLSHVVSNQLKLEQTANPFMRELSGKLNANSYLGVLDHTEGTVIYLSAVGPSIPIASIGLRAPVHSTALGKALIAYLPQTLLDRLPMLLRMPASTPHTITDAARLKEHLAITRRRGYATDEEESIIGVHCVAAPVQHYSGNVVAAISVSAPSYHFTRARIPEIARYVCECTNAVSRALGCPEEMLIRWAEEPQTDPSSEREGGEAIRRSV